MFEFGAICEFYYTLINRSLEVIQIVDSDILLMKLKKQEIHSIRHSFLSFKV